MRQKGASNAAAGARIFGKDAIIPASVGRVNWCLRQDAMNTAAMPAQRPCVAGSRMVVDVVANFGYVTGQVLG